MKKYKETISKQFESAQLPIASAFCLQKWHKALLAKLASYRLPEEICTWNANFLSERSTKVLVDGLWSDIMHRNAGVPQGSVFSPTLCIYHINNMLLTSSIQCYADDSTVESHYTHLTNFNMPRCLQVEDNRLHVMSEIETFHP